jgi:hypothetical protein
MHKSGISNSMYECFRILGARWPWLSIKVEQLEVSGTARNLGTMQVPFQIPDVCCLAIKDALWWQFLPRVGRHTSYVVKIGKSFYIYILHKVSNSFEVLCIFIVDLLFKIKQSWISVYLFHFTKLMLYAT